MIDHQRRPPGRPKIHPITDDRYRLTATKVTVIVLSVIGDEITCRYATREEEVTFSRRWLEGHADLQYFRRKSP